VPGVRARLVNTAALPGFEPRTTDPESVVLPITPQGIAHPRQELNLRHPPPEDGALSTELRGQTIRNAFGGPGGR
jgi:hypothetical protein